MRTQVMIFGALALLLAAGCDDEGGGDAGTGPIDGGSDGRIDGATPDGALADGALADGTVADAARDAMADASVDAMLDAATDAMTDATADAMADATADAMPGPDARLDGGLPADAGPDQGGGDCVPAGGSVPVIPNAPFCCPGLQLIGCERPGADGTCPAGCEGASICAACGDGVCGPGENPCNCFADCPPPGPCDDGSPLVCEIERPDCEPGEVRAVIDGCWSCVNPATCRPWGQPGCAADGDCDPGEVCDPCGTSSCPLCDNCIPACRPGGGPICPGPDPAGCRERGCPPGLACEVGDACIPSTCFCGDNGIWACTEDCGGGECVPPAGALRWYETCGDPVCRGHMPIQGMPLCMVDETPGNPCADADRLCDPVDPCNIRRVCADRDPRQDGCPISRAEHKRDIRYLDAAERRRYAEALIDTPLATWRYNAAPAARPSLGFIIDDGISPEAITADGTRVDLYGYTSLAVAAVQVQAEEIARLRADLDALRARLDAAEAQCR